MLAVQEENRHLKMTGTITYEGSCHCGGVRFSFESEPIRIAMRCNCSICRRKNAIMSLVYFEGDKFRITNDETLSNYLFEPNMVNHYFCDRCGIYPFHNGVESPDKYRVNLCCVDAIETHELEIRVFDGRDSWEFLTS